MSQFYPKGLEALLARTIPESASFFVCGLGEGYEYSATHVDLADVEDFILSGMGAEALAGVTMTNGVLDANDVQWLAVVPDPEQSQVVGVVIFMSWDSGASTQLLAWIDDPALGLPQALTGVNITARWKDAGILKI